MIESYYTTEALDEKTELRVYFDYYPGRPGKMYLSNGDPGYPDEPETVEPTSIEIWQDGKKLPIPSLPYELFDEEKLFDLCWEKIRFEYEKNQEPNPFSDDWEIL